MKIVRLGNTETYLLFVSYIMKYGNEPPELKKQLSNILRNYTNWLYTTAGYYDKAVQGTHFNFDDTELFDTLEKFPVTDVFLATDNLERGYAFTQRSKHRYHIFRDNSLDWQQNALADMLLLSKGNLLFTPQFSTFSELAWYWGNCQQDVCNYRSSDFFQKSGQTFKTVWHRGTNHEKPNGHVG